MSRLINRKAASRIDCLHSLMQLLNEEFPAESNFSMNDAKYDSSKKNIFGFCPLLLTHEGLGFSYCPYKQNPLDKSACGLTNSVDLDSTKQKEVSNTLNALEGLGFLWGVDKFMSEARAITNIIGNGVATLVIAKSEKEFDAMVYAREIDNPSGLLEE